MAGMMRDKDRVGRCSVQGHGQDCIVTQEIQAPKDRAYEKREVQRDIDEQLDSVVRHLHMANSVIEDDAPMLALHVAYAHPGIRVTTHTERRQAHQAEHGL